MTRTQSSTSRPGDSTSPPHTPPPVRPVVPLRPPQPPAHQPAPPPASPSAQPIPQIEITRPVPGLHGHKPEAAPVKAAINVKAFNAWYAAFQALHSIDLSIPHCRVTSFIGPSGC